MAQALQISKTHAHEMSSVLLQKLYTLFAPDGIDQLINLLFNRNLSQQAYRQLLLYDKKNQDKPAAECAQFYRIAFELSLCAIPKERECSIISYFAEKYLASIKSPSIADRLYIEMRRFRAQIVDVYLGKDLSKVMFRSLRQKIEYFANENRKYGNNQSMHELHRIFIEYYMYIDRNPQALCAHITYAKDTITSLPEFIRKEEEVEFCLLDAFAEYVQGNFASAYRIYNSHIPFNEIHDVNARSIHHILKYAESAALIGESDVAVSILNDLAERGTLVGDLSLVTSAYIRLTVIQIMNNNFAAANKYVQRARQSNRQKYYMLIDDMRLRYLETVIAYLRYDWKNAQKMIDRSIQFLREKGKKLSESDEGYYFKFIDAVMLNHEIGKPLPKKVEEHYQKYSVGQFRFFGQLLEKVLLMPYPA